MIETEPQQLLRENDAHCLDKADGRETHLQANHPWEVKQPSIEAYTQPEVQIEKAALRDEAALSIAHHSAVKIVANVEEAHLEDNGSLTTSQQSHDAFRKHKVQIDDPAPDKAEQSKSSEAGAAEDHNEEFITAKADEVALTKEQETPVNTGIQPDKPSESLDAVLWPAGYYYQDSRGNTQGPCNLEYLQALHASFSEAAHMTIWAGDGTGGGYCARLFEVLHWAAPQQSQQQQHSAWATSSASAPLSKLHSSNAPQSASGQPHEQQHPNAWTQTCASAPLSEQLSGSSPQGATMQQQQQSAWASRAASACLSAPHTEYQNGATAGEASTLPAKCLYAEAVLAGTTSPLLCVAQLSSA